MVSIFGIARKLLILLIHLDQNNYKKFKYKPAYKLLLFFTIREHF